MVYGHLWYMAYMATYGIWLLMVYGHLWHVATYGIWHIWPLMVYGYLWYMATYGMWPLMVYGHLWYVATYFNLVVTNLFMRSLSGMIPLYLAMLFYTEGTFA